MNPLSEPTLRDIAKALGVSHATVSRALHDHPRISPARRLEIQSAALKMGYRPNPMAAALGQQRHQQSQEIHTAIGWLNFWEKPKELFSHQEFVLYWKGAHSVAERMGYRLEEFACNSQVSPSHMERILLTRDIRGILIPPHRQRPDGWENFRLDRFSVVRFGYSVTHPRVHLVTSDQLSHSMLAFDNIRRLGYQRIGFVSSRLNTTRCKAGFLMKQLELDSNLRVPILLLPEREHHFVDAEPICEWLEQHRPDAILTDIADMREMLAKAGYRVPEDIGLATFSVLDGKADAGIFQNSEEIGKAAMELLISQMTHHHIGVPAVCREILIEGSWVDGRSLPPRV